MATRLTQHRDPTGAPWEKRGNTVWVRCAGCDTWFPVSPTMQRPGAPDCHCPNCHYEFPSRSES